MLDGLLCVCVGGGGCTVCEYLDSYAEEFLVWGTGVADGEGGDAGDAVEAR